MYICTSNTGIMGKISITGMEFFAYHGCFAEEQIIGNRFLVDVELVTDTSAAELSDDLSRTVNYQQVFFSVRREMQQKSKLIEHVARRIADALLREFPAIESLSVSVHKMNPPLGGVTRSVSCTLVRP